MTVSFTIFVFLAVANLVGTNILATQGYVVGEYEREIMGLEKENHILSIKIEEEINMKSLEELAVYNGFVSTKNIVFAPTTTTVASR